MKLWQGAIGLPLLPILCSWNLFPAVPSIGFESDVTVFTELERPQSGWSGGWAGDAPPLWGTWRHAASQWPDGRALV